MGLRRNTDPWRRLCFMRLYQFFWCSKQRRLDYQNNDYWSVTSLNKENHNLPSQSQLYQNFPNPFNPETNISYSLIEPGRVSITLFDLTGKKIKTILAAYQIANKYSIKFRSENIARGIYFYQLKVNDTIVDIKKMILLR